MISNIRRQTKRIAIAGAGPAGASLAIRLANSGFEVVLIERDKFPRRKLCGEFVSPECLRHFRELGVFDEMMSVGGDRIVETVFYDANGKGVSVPSKWFSGDSPPALSISRAEMDFRLLTKARDSGVHVFESSSATDVLISDGLVHGVKIKCGGELKEIEADLTIDASGRAGVLTKFARRREAEFAAAENSRETRFDRKISRAKLVGFKSHLKNVSVKKGVCEIYFFPGGYGGLSNIENDLANHCFLVKSETVRKFNGDAEKIVENVVKRNKRANETLKNSGNISGWLTVSIDSFGEKELCPAPGLLSVGDASAFIDPFTGSGMLMAFEGAEILASLIADRNADFAELSGLYRIAHQQKFRSRLRLSSMMRYAAFVPGISSFAINALSMSAGIRELLARSTRTAPFAGIKKQ